MKPKAIVVPNFQEMDEIFDSPTLERLHDLVDVQWGRNDCAPAFGPAVAEHALALSLATGRLIAAGDSAFRVGSERWLHDGNVGATLHYGKTIGFVGAGGGAIAQPAASARAIRGAVLGIRPVAGRRGVA